MIPAGQRHTLVLCLVTVYLVWGTTCLATRVGVLLYLVVFSCCFAYTAYAWLAHGLSARRAYSCSSVTIFSRDRARSLAVRIRT